MQSNQESKIKNNIIEHFLDLPDDLFTIKTRYLTKFSSIINSDLDSAAVILGKPGLCDSGVGPALRIQGKPKESKIKTGAANSDIH